MHYQLSILTRFFSIPVALLFVLLPLQAQNQITENPQGAEKLRRIWYLLGGTHIPLVGIGAGALGDLDNDRYADFSVRVGTEAWIYRGGAPPSDTPVTKIDSVNIPSVRGPVAGNFFGNDTIHVGFVRARCDTFSGACFVRVFFYKADVDSLLVPVDYILDLNEQACRFSMHAKDLDRDGDDELIVINSEEVCNHTIIRIYEGGEDFDLSEPDYIIRDEESNEQRSHRAAVVDFDGDKLLDLVLMTRYPDMPKLKVWWGTQFGPSDWTNQPGRTVPLPPGQITPSISSFSFQLYDFDGDSAADLRGTINLTPETEDSAGTYLWLSTKASARSRPFDRTDTNVFFPLYSSRGSYGYVADTTNRYQMIALSPMNEPTVTHGFSGGKEGPNMTYDAYFGSGDGPSGGGVTANDVNGDGWTDRLNASSEYGGAGVGAALIIAGGVYIPVDDTTLSVRSIATEEHKAALHIWPNPVIDELHIAWRGDLQRRPSQLAVFDMQSREVVRGEVNYWRGEAVWECGSVASGAYLLVVYDNQGAILASEEVIVQ